MNRNGKLHVVRITQMHSRDCHLQLQLYVNTCSPEGATKPNTFSAFI